MMELWNLIVHLYQLIVTWTVVGCLTAPIVFGIYCWDHRGEE